MVRRAVARRVGEADRPHLAGAEVAVDVAAVERGERAVADDVAADDRAGPDGVRVVEHRARRSRAAGARARRRLGQRVGDLALALVPAEVRAARAPVAPEVDLLAGALPDVADDEVAGLAVEREAERVAQAVVEHGDVGDDVAGRDRVRATPCAGRCAAACRAASRCSGRCRTDRRRRRRRPCRRRGSRRGRTGAGRRCGWRTAEWSIVSSGRAVERVGGVGVGGRAPVLRDADVALLVDARRGVVDHRVVDVEAPRGRVVGGEGHRQQPALAVGRVLPTRSRKVRFVPPSSTWIAPARSTTNRRLASAGGLVT